MNATFAVVLASVVTVAGPVLLLAAVLLRPFYIGRHR